MGKLAEDYPDLVNEWHPTLNGELEPWNIASKSGKKVWWRCAADNSHEWQATIHNRSKGSRCPVCAGRKLLTGFNDFASVRPDLVAEWDFDRNLKKPDEVLAGSSLQAWWKCSKNPDHYWQAKVSLRTKGSGCRVCLGQVVISGVNDFAYLHPELLPEWDFEKNKTCLPTELSESSNKKVWWRCKADSRHQWQATLSNRVGRQSGCPFCSNRKSLEFISLASKYPQLESFWHNKFNGSTTPDTISYKSKGKYFWQCDRIQRHHWTASINRMAQGMSCPACNPDVKLEVIGNFASKRPDLLEEWAYDLNSEIWPKSIKPGSQKHAYWRCLSDSSHIWKASISSRNRGSGCPFCSGRLVVPGSTDLASLHPEVAKEWHPTKNEGRLPQDFRPGSKTYAWWQCSTNPDHIWRALIKHRANGARCPGCATGGFDSSSAGLIYFIQNEALSARKIGITNTNIKTDRLDIFTRKGWVLLHKTEFNNGADAMQIESEMLYWIRNTLQLPQYLGQSEMTSTGGATETFSIDGPNNDLIIQKIIELVQQLSKP